MGSSSEYSKLASDEEEVFDAKLIPSLPRRRASCSPLKRCLCCMAVVVALLFVPVLLFGAVGTFWLANNIQRFTVTEPRKLPVVDVPEAKIQVKSDEIKLFVDQLRAGVVPDHDLEIHADDVNGAISLSDQRGNAFVTMSEGKLAVDTSFPTDGLPGGCDRYFVASGSVDISAEQLIAKFDTLHKVKDFEGHILYSLLHLFQKDDGHVGASVREGEIFGWELHGDFIDNEEDILEDVYNDPEAGAVIGRIESIQLEANKIVIKPSQTSLTTIPTQEGAGGWHFLRRRLF